MSKPTTIAVTTLTSTSETKACSLSAMTHRRHISESAPMPVKVRALARLRALLETWRASGRGGVLACSALKVAYRDMLDVGGVAFRLLTASPEVLRHRLRHRAGHFFDPQLLGSQLATLEAPSGTRAFETSGATPEQVADALVASLG